MSSTKRKKRLESQLPERLVDALQDLSDKYRDQGVRLFIFGSFASSEHRPNSDLDIGLEWTSQRSSELYRQIRKDIWNLPTIRKVDLVDLSKVSTDFAKETQKHRIYL